eukprot:1146870-Pelagomonas_calceolata.AAC.2
MKLHAAIAGNDCADAIAKHQANQANNSVADTGSPGAGIREHAAGTSTAPAPAPKLTYLANLQNALKSHACTKLRLGHGISKQATALTIRARYLILIR